MVITNGPMSGKAQKATYYVTNAQVFIEGMESFSISFKAGTAETTSALTGNDLKDKTFIGTLREWTGSMKLKYVNFTNTAVALMWTQAGLTAPVAAEFWYDASTKATGSIVITGFDLDTSIDGICSGTVTFQGTGALTPATTT